VQTIVEPKKHIADLWGKQRIREDQTYRLMKYVLRVDHEGKMLLHNVVTGQLVVLDQEEADAVDHLPQSYGPEMKRLVTEHYLVPEDYDEFHQVRKLRSILWKLRQSQMSVPTEIRRYTILPTTACNARCYYCFEKGCKTLTMTESVAKDVVGFIARRSQGDPVTLSWFGGEPTIAANRIDQICSGLRERGIVYRSEITTNGYLFDEQMVACAGDLWNLNRVMISVDGVENTYNSIKAYINAMDNPYQKVMRNVSLLLSREIRVEMRMNFDLNNIQDFELLAKEMLHRFKGNSLFRLTAYPVIGRYVNNENVVLHGTDEWFQEKIVVLNRLAAAMGLRDMKISLPCLRFEGCEACDCRAVVICADGSLVRCPEQFGPEQIVGNIYDEVIFPDRVASWQQFVEYEKCRDCPFYPFCNRIANCNVKDRCNFRPWMFLTNETSIITRFVNGYS